jgi:hypothetical protein
MKDERDTSHLLIGLSKHAVESIQRGEIVTLPGGQNLPLTDESDIVLIYEDSEEALIERMNAGFQRSEAEGLERENKPAKHRHRTPAA